MRIGIFGGGFKPFTSGHFSKLALASAENDRVLLFYAIAERKKGNDYLYTKEMAEQVFEIAKAAIEREMPNVIVLKARPTPIVMAFEAIQAFAGTLPAPKFFRWSDVGINVGDIDEITLYGDQETVDGYMVYADDPVKGPLYYGTTLRDGTLHFDTGMVEGDDSRIINAVMRFHPGGDPGEIRARNLVRGTDVRASIASRNPETITRFLPPIYTPDEKTAVIDILYRGLSENTLRRAIRAMIMVG
jgi:hypothetical protein